MYQEGLALSTLKMCCTVAVWQVPNSPDKLHNVMLEVPCLSRDQKAVNRLQFLLVL